MKNKKKIKIQSILFDLDGTIIDTEAAAARVIQRVFQEWEIQLAPQDATYVTGRTWESVFQYLFQKYPIPLSHSQAQDLLLSRYRDSIHDELIVVPGSVSAVQTLAQHYPLGLVSGSHREDILWSLRKLKIDHHFQIILGAEDYPRSKPHPDGFLKALELLKSPPETCLIFEDSTAGIQSARSAGAWVVAITGTNHFQQSTHHAHFQIPDLTGVTEKWIDELTFQSEQQ